MGRPVQTALEVAYRDLAALRQQRAAAVRDFDTRIQALESAIRLLRNVYETNNGVLLAGPATGPLERVRAILKSNPQQAMTPVQIKLQLIAGGQHEKDSEKATDQMVHQCLRRLVEKDEVKKIQHKPRKASYIWVNTEPEQVPKVRAS